MRLDTVLSKVTPNSSIAVQVSPCKRDDRLSSSHAHAVEIHKTGKLEHVKRTSVFAFLDDFRKELEWKPIITQTQLREKYVTEKNLQFHLKLNSISLHSWKRIQTSRFSCSINNKTYQDRDMLPGFLGLNSRMLV